MDLTGKKVRHIQDKTSKRAYCIFHFISTYLVWKMLTVVFARYDTNNAVKQVTEATRS